jgi:hypothetical protein
VTLTCNRHAAETVGFDHLFSLSFRARADTDLLLVSYCL